MRTDFHESLVHQVQSVAEHAIGDLVYVNVPNGPIGLVFAYVIYESHIEYLVRTLENGVMQMDVTSISAHRRIALE